MLPERFLGLFSLSMIIVGSLVATADLIEKETRLLNRIDNAHVVQTLVVTYDQVLNDFINDQISIKSQRARAVIWNQLPSDGLLEQYFKQNFQVIQYDATFRDLPMKDFDYTRYHTFSDGRTWEKFVFIRVRNEFITLFFSYTMEWSIRAWIPFNNYYGRAALPIEKFFGEASALMFTKLFDPLKSVYSHGLPLVDDKSTIRYILVYHNNHDGYIEKVIPSFEDGLRQQEDFNKQKLSSCIVIVADGQKSIHSIRHPIIPGHIVPDFHAYYGVKSPKKVPTLHKDL